MKTTAIMHRILRWGAGLAIAVALVGGLVGYFIAGVPGVMSALVGAALAFAFCGLTAVTMLVALRASGDQMLSGAFFGIVLGGWLAKFALFILLVFTLSNLDWLHRGVAFGALVTAVIGSLVIDCVAIATSRQPIVASLPDDGTEGRPASRPRA